MHKNNFYPLRTIVGSSIPIASIRLLQRPATTFQIETRLHRDLAATVEDEVYSRFLPDIIENGTTYRPHAGMNTLPIPKSNPSFPSAVLSLLNLFENQPDNPFADSDPVSSIYGYEKDNFIQLELNAQSNNDPYSAANLSLSRTNHFHSGRDRSYTFIISLKKEVLVGGICFGGYPYICSRIENTAEGMTLGNFGLPREIRLTPLPALRKDPGELKGFQRSQFIDAEFAYTRQEIISHSGLNYLSIDPVKTNLFQLTITDLPFIPKIIDLDSGTDDFSGLLSIKGFKGFAIPYLYFFEYEETTKKSARVHSGLLGVKTDTVYPLKEDGTQDILRGVFPEYEFYLQNKKNSPDGSYIVYTAHSALGQRRSFQFSALNFNYPQSIKDLPFDKDKRLPEYFVSDLLQRDEKVTLYLQQGEEYDRCLAGLKALFLLLPGDSFSERLAERFASLLGVGVIDNQLSDDERNIIEDALAFAFSLPPEINFCDKVQLKIYEIDPPEGVSPASVNLTSKYAILLSDVVVDDYLDVIFNYTLKGIPFKRVSSSKYFAIEFINRGSPGQVVIHSMEMVRSAHVSVQPRAARTQQVKAMHYRIIGPELADDFAKLGGDGFNFSIDRLVAGQTKNVLYHAMSLLDLLHTGGAKIHSNARRRAVEFEKTVTTDEGIPESNFEQRKSCQTNTGWRSSETGEGVNADELDTASCFDIKPTTDFENYGNSENRIHNNLLFPHNSGPWNLLRNYLNLIATVSGRGSIKIEDVLNVTNNLTHDRWLGKNWKGFRSNELRINGVNSVSTTPFSSLQAINDLIDTTDGATEPLDLVTSLPELFLPAVISILTGGSNSSISVSPAGIGLSIGYQSPFTLSHASQYGSTGNISKQAFETRYAFSQFLVKGGDTGHSKSIVTASEMKRVVTRREVPDTDDQRVKGAEVMWQGKLQDIITGSIPLNFFLPATATKMNFKTADDTLRVRFNSGFSPSIEVDFWFELTEETIRDDY